MLNFRHVILVLMLISLHFSNSSLTLNATENIIKRAELSALESGIKEV